MQLRRAYSNVQEKKLLPLLHVLLNVKFKNSSSHFFICGRHVCTKDTLSLVSRNYPPHLHFWVSGSVPLAADNAYSSARCATFNFISISACKPDTNMATCPNCIQMLPRARDELTHACLNFLPGSCIRNWLLEYCSRFAHLMTSARRT